MMKEHKVETCMPTSQNKTCVLSVTKTAQLLPRIREARAAANCLTRRPSEVQRERMGGGGGRSSACLGPLEAKARRAISQQSQK